MNCYKILYEDNHLLGLVKPFNSLVQMDHTGDEALTEWIKSYLKEKYGKPGNVFIGMVHRLDRPVGGVMIFARTSKAASRLSKQFREHSVEKQYLAWVEGKLENTRYQRVESYLKKNRKTNKVTVFKRQTPEALKAELEYRMVRMEEGRTLVEIKLHTGRPHQIRAQMASLGHPVAGDLKYGAGKPLGKKNIALFAHFLSVEHPVTKERVVLTAEPEAGWSEE